jgi:hypothetical protein
MLKFAALALALASIMRADWITHGKAYHVRRDCIALRTTKQPTEITRADAVKRGLHLCGICARVKKVAK